MTRLPIAFAALLLALPASAQQFETGRVTVEHCAPCHGRDGIAPDSEVPNLAGQNERYLYNQLMAFRSGARRHREMRVMARELTEAEIAAIAAYYASLPPR